MCLHSVPGRALVVRARGRRQDKRATGGRARQPGAVAIAVRAGERRVAGLTHVPFHGSKTYNHLFDFFLKGGQHNLYLGPT